jgi:hypothetical protein
MGGLGGGGKGGKGELFAGGEDGGGNFGNGEFRVDEFEIDSEWVIAGDGDDGEIARMGDVELPGRVASQGGFAVGSVVEEDRFRGGAGVAAEELAEGGAAGDETGLVFLENEMGGAVAFGGREERGEGV